MGLFETKRMVTLQLWGRIDDVLNISGHRLGTMEIESALVAYEDVAEAAVVGKPDEVTGESIVAFVVLKSKRPENIEEISEKSEGSPKLGG